MPAHRTVALTMASALRYSSSKQSDTIRVELMNWQSSRNHLILRADDAWVQLRTLAGKPLN